MCYSIEHYKNYLKNKLSEYGFKFDKNGRLNNFQERLKELIYYANLLKGYAKEREIQKIKEIYELAEMYAEILSERKIKNDGNIVKLLQKELKNINDISYYVGMMQLEDSIEISNKESIAKKLDNVQEMLKKQYDYIYNSLIEFC